MQRQTLSVPQSSPRSWRRWLFVPALIAAVAWLIGSAVPDAFSQAPTPTATPFQRPGGRFEENDPALLYSGTWTAVNDSRASGGSLRRSDTQGAAVQLTFPGANVRWITTKGPNRGIAHILIDGQEANPNRVDLYASTEQFLQEFSWGGLASDQNHTIRIEVTGERTGASTGTIVDVDAFVASGATAAEVLQFEDTDPSLLYSGNWTTVMESRATAGVLHRSNQVSAAVQFTFSGPNVRWVTTRGPNRGIAHILIDGQDANPSRVDLYAPQEESLVEVTWGGLAGDQNHTIRIEVTGQRSGPATDSFVDVDAFLVQGAPATPVPTPTTAPTATATSVAAATATPVPAATPTATPAAPTPTGTIPPAPTAVHDQRFSPETRFRVDHDPFWDYFGAMGDIRTFGFPISRTITFLGCTTQFFQRQLLQQCGAGAPVQTMNLLDPDLMGFNRINGSTFPEYNPEVAAGAPPPGTPNYGVAVLSFVQATAPETFQGLPVRFFSTFVNTVPGSDPQADPDFAALVNLQIWGFPTSDPASDPNNQAFVYHRYQRGIMHFDASVGATQGILLADWFRSLITGDGLPPDLAAQAQAARSRYLSQYCPGAPQWVCRPAELPATDLTFAFEPQ